MANSQRNFIAFLLVVVAAIPLLAGDDLIRDTVPPPPGHEHEWCATSRENNLRLEALQEWTRARRLALAKGEVEPPRTRSRVEDDIIVLEASKDMIPFDHSFDLEGKSLVWEPDYETGFFVSAVESQWDDDLGELFHTFMQSEDDPEWYYRRLDLEKLIFPLAGFDRTTLYISSMNGITFTPPRLSRVDQLTALEAASYDEPMVAPLLLSRSTRWQFGNPEVYFKETVEAATITWRIEPTEFFEYAVQARLEASGRVTLSYGTIRNVDWGAVIVTTGRESWRARSSIVDWGDHHYDTVPTTVENMLLIEGASIDRIGDTGYLEITLDLVAPIARQLLGEGGSIGYRINFNNGAPAAEVRIDRKDTYLYVPSMGWRRESPAVKLTGDKITLFVDRKRISFGDRVSIPEDYSDYFNVWTQQNNRKRVKRVSTPVQMYGVSDGKRQADLSRAYSESTLLVPGLEAYSLPTLNPLSVWIELDEDPWFEVFSAQDESEEDIRFNSEEVDAVAIYQDFLTDIVLYAAAYSTVGNPGVDGIATDNGSDWARFPALLHVNHADYGYNTDLDQAVHILSHELGHRWLYFIDIDAGEGSTNVLRPGGAHPAQYVHMPAAFNVYSNRDSSTMGGASFSDNQDGTFTAPDPIEYFGYTWHELYLMGLAGPEEVEDWYYIENSDPQLGPAYYPPPGITVSGTRRHVAIKDVIRAMGPRFPAYPQAQKRFRVLFVLLHRRGTEPDPAMIERVSAMRREFDRVFPLITGGRGSIESRVVIPPRRRGVRN